jgi:hypothetical protein
MAVCADTGVATAIDRRAAAPRSFSFSLEYLQGVMETEPPAAVDVPVQAGSAFTPM